MKLPSRNGDEGGDNRGVPVTVDLERLEKQAEQLFLHRFVESVRKARGEHGRYLTLRTGDTLAIRAAEDGSAEILDTIAVESALD